MEPGSGSETLPIPMAEGKGEGVAPCPWDPLCGHWTLMPVGRPAPPFLWLEWQLLGGADLGQAWGLGLVPWQLRCMDCVTQGAGGLFPTFLGCRLP